MGLPNITIKIPPLPQTTTILALGLLGGILLYTPLLAFIGERVPEAYVDEVVKTGQFFRDAMLMVLGYYFAKVVNAGQKDMAARALDVAASATPPRTDAPEEPGRP